MIEIALKNVSFAYTTGISVLNDINLKLGGGDTRAAALVGQNGAGKTTLVKLLKGLLRPSEGCILINGENISKTTAAELAGQIGLVFQNPNDQIFKKSVLEEVLFGPLNIKMDAASAKYNSLRAIEAVGLKGTENENPHDLSLSERKLLCIASILAMDTQAVILDEPTIAQDSRGRQKISELIGLLKSEGKLVLTIAHDMDFVADNFERTVIMNEGRILLDADTRVAFSSMDALNKARLEQPHITRLSSRLDFANICLTTEEFKREFNK